MGRVSIGWEVGESGESRKEHVGPHSRTHSSLKPQTFHFSLSLSLSKLCTVKETVPLPPLSPLQTS